MTDEKQGTRASLEQLADSLRTAPKYCNEHKPCDAKEHRPGYSGALALFTLVFGSLIYGLVLMIGVNVVLADWLEVVPHVGYWTSVAGTLSLYVLRLVIRV